MWWRVLFGSICFVSPSFVTFSHYKVTDLFNLRPLGLEWLWWAWILSQKGVTRLDQFVYPIDQRPLYSFTTKPWRPQTGSRRAKLQCFMVSWNLVMNQPTDLLCAALPLSKTWNWIVKVADTVNNITPYKSGTSHGTLEFVFLVLYTINIKCPCISASCNMCTTFLFNLETCRTQLWERNIKT